MDSCEEHRRADGVVKPVRARAGDLADAICAGGSSTAALQQWCERFGIGSGHVEAHCRPSSSPVSPSAAVCDSLAAQDGNSLAFRHVVLRRGVVHLCEAINWYDPARLTPAMNHALQTTAVPFGVVIAALGIHRINTVIWCGNDGPEARATPMISDAQWLTPGTILEVEARVVTVSGAPLAVVRERYSSALLG